MRDKKKVVQYVFLGTGLGVFLLAPIISTMWFVALSAFREAMLNDFNTEPPGFMLGMFSTLSGGLLGGLLGYVVCSRLPEKEIAANRKQNAFIRFALSAVWGFVYAFVGAVIGLAVAVSLAKAVDPAPDSPLAFEALAGGPIGMIVGLCIWMASL